MICILHIYDYDGRGCNLGLIICLVICLDLLKPPPPLPPLPPLLSGRLTCQVAAAVVNGRRTTEGTINWRQGRPSRRIYSVTSKWPHPASTVSREIWNQQFTHSCSHILQSTIWDFLHKRAGYDDGPTISGFGRVRIFSEAKIIELWEV